MIVLDWTSTSRLHLSCTQRAGKRSKSLKEKERYYRNWCFYPRIKGVNVFKHVPTYLHFGLARYHRYKVKRERNMKTYIVRSNLKVGYPSLALELKRIFDKVYIALN